MFVQNLWYDFSKVSLLISAGIMWQLPRREMTPRMAPLMLWWEYTQISPAGYYSFVLSWREDDAQIGTVVAVTGVRPD
ncbi:hypothetical protein DD606_26185 [Enterobacter cloacae complex sp. GF14B]|nr:hypothetical protein DD606_26185 [Enterobacter cloacae complex sp. GF14B]